MITTLRDYAYIIVLLLALAATCYLRLGRLLTGLTRETVARLEVKRR